MFKELLLGFILISILKGCPVHAEGEEIPALVSPHPPITGCGGGAGEVVELYNQTSITKPYQRPFRQRHPKWTKAGIRMHKVCQFWAPIIEVGGSVFQILEYTK